MFVGMRSGNRAQANRRRYRIKIVIDQVLSGIGNGRLFFACCPNDLLEGLGSTALLNCLYGGIKLSGRDGIDV